MSTPTGREKLLALQNEEAIRAKRKKTSLLSIALLAVIALAVGCMYLATRGGDKENTMLDGSYVQAMQSVPESSFNTVGRGNSTNLVKLRDIEPETGTPNITYFGGEYCPFCAMQRWSVVSALSRFGTWKGLTAISSSEGQIPTVSFAKATFSSPYVKFHGYELKDQDHNPLMKASPADQARFDKYDTPAYIPGMDPKETGSIPFILFGSDYASSGAMFNDANEMANASGAEVASKLKDPSSSEARNILGAANVITARICSQNGGKPAHVCSSQGVKNAEQ